MSAKLTIGVVGDGPVGKAFAIALSTAGHEIIQRKSIPDLLEFADLVIFAIPDEQLELTITGITEGKMWRAGQLVAHTSGRYGYGILNPAAQAGAIPLAIHPAMKFTGNSSDIARIRESYFAVSAPAVALPIAQALVIEMGAEPITIAEEDRDQYFEAISVASNFSSMIVNQSIGLLEEIGIEPATQMLAPLIRSTVEVALSQGHKPIDPTELLGS